MSFTEHRNQFMVREMGKLSGRITLMFIYVICYAFAAIPP
jgi:hypothetical protein